LLPEAVQQQVIDLYFGPTGQNYTVGRVHMNSCDFSLASYSFDDTPGDFALTNFNTSHDQLYQMPMVKVRIKPTLFSLLNFTGAV
jgi:glucosylceramidase